jgi:molecular chaperone DnaJ
MATTCPICRGLGEMIEDPCTECGGGGLVEETRKLSLTIPAGVDDGTRMRLSGEGEGGTRGGPSGDLYVFLFVKPHDSLVREGFDLHTKAPVDFVQAALGASIEVQTIEGSREIEVPRGSQPNDKITIRGAGVPRLRGYGKGNLVVHLKVSIPKKLNEEQDRLLRGYAESTGLNVAKRRKGFFERLKN